MATINMAVTSDVAAQLAEAVIQLDHGDEPPGKRIKLEKEDLEMSTDLSIKQILFNINKAICLRLDAIENKLETINSRTKILEDKVGNLSAHVGPSASSPSDVLPSNIRIKAPSDDRGSAVIVGLPQGRLSSSSRSSPPNASLDNSVQALGPNVTLITLNTEDDFPTGSWLGDETNPEMRVRVHITPSDMLHIHSNCRTAEKMALTLLDYLFDRDVQAQSNLSGMGKHGKKQLDPLMIYGIRCHLIHKFNITEQDWHRIKQNIDSKCRTAFRRKIRGLPLTVKAFRGKAPPTYVHMNENGMPIMHSMDDASDDDSLNQGEDLQIAQDGVDVPGGILSSEIIQSAGGEIQVLHATPEQVAQLQQTHQIQILQGDQVMQLQQGEGQEPIHVQVSMAGDPNNIQVITPDNGETITINPVGSGDEDTQDNTDDGDDHEQ